MRWKPDHCNCVVLLEGVSGVIERRCSVHTAAGASDVLLENRLKNLSVAALEQVVPSFAGKVTWRFDASRSVVLTPPGAMSGGQRNNFRTTLRTILTSAGISDTDASRVLVE